jgi:outer membrane protein TolC
MTRLTTWQRFRAWRSAGLAPLILLQMMQVLIHGSAYAQTSAVSGTVALTLQDYIKRVLERNESLQERLIEVEINRRKAKGEYGVFEPELFGSVSQESNKRENTAEQKSAAFSQPTFSEINNIYQGGLQALAPSGAKVQLGYTLRDLRNSLQPIQGVTNNEYQTFFGITVTQPLLKNAWFPATLADLRIAALGSDIAFQDYRRQMMVVVSTAEASYWNLYMVQEQERFFHESVATAEKILNDNRERLHAGKGSELEVLEAESGLALRRSKLAEAEQKRYEAANRVITLYAESVTSGNPLVRAADLPAVNNDQISLFEAWKTAFQWNPDYLTQREKVMQEYVRVGYAASQRLPQLDLKGTYGLNGLGYTTAASWDDIQHGGFPSWSIGIEFHIPLAGGIKSANELAAAKLRRKEALVSLGELENQVANSLDTAIHKIASARQAVESYRTIIKFNQSLLDSALERLAVGRAESRKVFDIESDLFESKNSLVEALVNFQRAWLEFELLQGSLLFRRDLELSQKELQTRTSKLILHGDSDNEQYQRFIKDVQDDYERKHITPVPPDNSAQKRARDQIYQWQGEWDATNAPVIITNSPATEEMIRTLRQRMEEMRK